MQAREQHIKREKAGSNICSNEALCALTAAVYLAAMGPDGLKSAATACASNAHYLAEQLCNAGLKLENPGKEFFHEFVTVFSEDVTSDKESLAKELLDKLSDAGILGGLNLGGGRILWCATEKVSKNDMDELVAITKEVLG